MCWLYSKRHKMYVIDISISPEKRPDKAFLCVQVWIKLQEELWIRIYQTNTDSCICAMKTLGSLSLLGQYIFIPVLDGSILGIQSYNKQVMYKYPYSSGVIFQSMYKWFQLSTITL